MYAVIVPEVVPTNEPILKKEEKLPVESESWATKTLPEAKASVTVKGTLIVSPAQKDDLAKAPVEMLGEGTVVAWPAIGELNVGLFAKALKPGAAALASSKTNKRNNNKTVFISFFEFS